MTLQEWGQLEEALALHKQLEALFLEMGDKDGLQRSYCDRALILKFCGRLEEAMALLKKKMDNVNATGASMIAASNPGCMLQLRAGVQKFGQGQRVAHVVEILDEAYRAGGSKD